MDPYDNTSRNLYAELRHCKDICHQYNALLPSNDRDKNAILKSLFKTLGKNTTITQPFYCDFGRNIQVGDNFYANHNLIILDGAQVTIGDNVFIGPNCCISTANHPLNAEQRNTGVEYAIPIVIQDNVWLGAGVTVLSGVTIGRNSVIGAGSIVTKDIPDHVIAVGNPCSVLRPLTPQDKYDPTNCVTLSFNSP